MHLSTIDFTFLCNVKISMKMLVTDLHAVQNWAQCETNFRMGIHFERQSALPSITIFDRRYGLLSVQYANTTLLWPVCKSHCRDCLQLQVI